MNFIKDDSIDGILTSPPYLDVNAFEKYRDLKLPEYIALLKLLRKSRRSIKAQIVENVLGY